MRGAPKTNRIRLTGGPTFKVTPRKVEKRPGRNEPCDCGSGKKFKRCCGG